MKPLSASISKRPWPLAFVLRRLHSLVGLWLVVYLVEHLWVNAQAGLYAWDGGRRFVSLVNQIHALPYLYVVEFLFLALPFALHGLLGIWYAAEAAPNDQPSVGIRPSLPHYGRNKAYTWQRITAWLLVIGIVAHVVHMRFAATPTPLEGGRAKVCIRLVPALHPLMERLGATADAEEEGCVVAPTIGAAFFLLVWNTFTSPAWVLLYSFLVIASCYHAFNGLWTLCITWGLLPVRRQKAALYITRILMTSVILLGLFAIWGVYLTYRVQNRF